MPLSAWRVGWTRLVSRVQARPGPEVDPEAGSGEPGMPDGRGRTGLPAGPVGTPPLPSMGAGLRQGLRGEAGSLCELRLGKVEKRVRRTEEARVAGAPQRVAVLVMDLAVHDVPAPSAGLGRGAGLGVRREAEARPGVHLADRDALQPLERDAEQDEVDVGIDRRGQVPPLALQDERTQRRGIGAIGVDRLHRREGGEMAEAVPEGDAALPAVGMILAEVGDDGRERRVEVDPADLSMGEDALGREDRLGQRGEVEDRVAGDGDGRGDKRGMTGPADLAPLAALDTQHRAGDAPLRHRLLGQRPRGLEAHAPPSSAKRWSAPCSCQT
jgi:hypothetical protein